MQNRIRITFGDRELECQACDDRADFDQCFRQHRVDSLILGEDVEGQRAYDIVTVHSPIPARTRVRIGVVSSVQGVSPKILMRPALQELWIGFNSRVAVVDTAVPLIRQSFELDSTFYQFVPMARFGMTLAIHETGIVAISDGCEIVWTVATDVIASVELTVNGIQVGVSDAATILLDPATGKQI